MNASRRFAVIGTICLAVLGLTLPEDGVDGWVAAGDQAAARGAYTQALSLFEGRRGGVSMVGAALRMGQVHLAKHRFGQAERLLRQALADCAATGEAFAWTRLPASLCAPQASLALGDLFRQTARPAGPAMPSCAHWPAVRKRLPFPWPWSTCALASWTRLAAC